MTICIAEDRKSRETGVKLLLLSIHRHCPTVPVELFYPAADSDFATWLEALPNVALNREPLEGKQGWNVKPHAILATMSKGHDDVLWIDSDIILYRDFRPAMTSLERDTVVVTEEALWGPRGDPDGMRARAWGFEVGRVFPFSLNSCVVRFTDRHAGLLARWKELLSSETYVAVQQGHWRARPPHMLSDQDVLTAMLSSSEYSTVPVHILSRGTDIIQYFGPYGYTCVERALNLSRGMPPFVHAQGSRAWLTGAAKPGEPMGVRDRFQRLYEDLSPYTFAAQSYVDELEEDCSWMGPRSWLSALLRVSGLRQAPLVGLPVAFGMDAWRFLRGGKGLASRLRGA
jgi:hypothetical protein